jgi:hypothetical protein
MVCLFFGTNPSSYYTTAYRHDRERTCEMQSILRGGNRIVISTSTNVFTNLALERYLAENVRHQPKTRLFLLWRNEPCVVMGRYQNPYIECDLKFLSERRIDLARRYSGGGNNSIAEKKIVLLMVAFIVFHRHVLPRSWYVSFTTTVPYTFDSV